MEKSNHHTSVKRKSPFSNVRKSVKINKSNSNKTPADKSILHKIFHPDYILFDWEYFSRELEFE
jgi:hypothetical protein